MKLITKFNNDYYLCLHYRYTDRYMKKYNLIYKNRVCMIRITNRTIGKRIIKCAYTVGE